MPLDRIPSAADLPHRVRQFLADAPAAWSRWRRDLAANPALLWRTPAARLAAWVVLGAAIIILARVGVAVLSPGASGSAFVEPTRTATLYVACTNPECLRSAIVQQPMNFDGWPLTCAACGAPSVYRARLCPTCRSWYATIPGKPPICPACAAASARPPPDAQTKRPTDPDDEEDDW